MPLITKLKFPYVFSKVGDCKAIFLIATTPRGGHYFFL